MSRIGRAIIEVLLRTEQAKAQIQALKADLGTMGKGASATPGATGTDWKATGGLPPEFAKTKAAIDKTKADVVAAAQAASAAVKQQSSAATDQVQGDMSKLSAGAGALKSALLLGIIAFGVKVTQTLDSIIHFSEDARKATDQTTTSVRNLRDSLAQSMRITLDTSDVSKKVDDIGRTTQAAIAQMNEDGGGFWANFFASFGADSMLNEHMNKLQSNANQLQAMTKRSQDKARSDQAEADRRAAEVAANERLEGMERLFADQEIMDRELANRWIQARTDAEKDAIAKRRQEVDDTFAYRRMKIQMEDSDRAAAEAEQRAAKEKADAEAAQRIARIAADAFAREMERATSALYEAMDRAASANQSLTNQSLSKVTADVSRLAQLVDLRLRANGVDMRR